MRKKYIVELGRCERLYKAYIGNGKPNLMWLSPEVDLTPYAEPDMEQVRKDAYEKGLNDAWEAARWIADRPYAEGEKVFGVAGWHIIEKFTASEAIEKIRQYEQEKEEQEEKDFVTTEEVMRHYLDTFCKRNFCTKCILHTPDFTCGRGYSFLTSSPVSDEEVRRAYAAVIAKLKE